MGLDRQDVHARPAACPQGGCGVVAGGGTCRLGRVLRDPTIARSVGLRGLDPTYSLESLDQAGVDQQAVEAPRLRAVAAIEQPLQRSRICFCSANEGSSGRPAASCTISGRYGPSMVRSGRQIDRFEVDRVDRIGGEVARIARHQAPIDLDLVERRLDEGVAKSGWWSPRTSRKDSPGKSRLRRATSSA